MWRRGKTLVTTWVHFVFLLFRHKTLAADRSVSPPPHQTITTRVLLRLERTMNLFGGEGGREGREGEEGREGGGGEGGRERGREGGMGE